MDVNHSLNSSLSITLNDFGEGNVSDQSSTTVDSLWSNEIEDSQASNIIINREMEELREWAVEAEVKQVYLDKLLAILRRRLLPD